MKYLENNSTHYGGRKKSNKKKSKKTKRKSKQRKKIRKKTKKTGRKINVNSKLGKLIIGKYRKKLGIGGGSEKDNNLKSVAKKNANVNHISSVLKDIKHRRETVVKKNINILKEGVENNILEKGVKKGLIVIDTEKNTFRITDKVFQMDHKNMTGGAAFGELNDDVVEAGLGIATILFIVAIVHEFWPELPDLGLGLEEVAQQGQAHLRAMEDYLRNNPHIPRDILAEARERAITARQRRVNNVLIRMGVDPRYPHLLNWRQWMRVRARQAIRTLRHPDDVTDDEYSDDDL